MILVNNEWQNRASIDDKFPELVPVKIVRVSFWNERMPPKIGTKIGYRMGNWSVIKDDIEYEATGDYIGSNLAALDESKETKSILDGK